MILVCSICGASHYTQNCPEYAKGDHVKDKPALNLSRSSVPNGLLIMDTHEGSCVVTSQKFAKGTRFGPLLAQKSYVPIKHIPFPLVLFAGPYYSHHQHQQQQQDEYSSDLQALLNSTRNVYLDTRNESKCNWMIHVNLARFSNEQNLICYQENDEIYYTAIKDIELGDILRVWYSRNYAAKIGASMLEPSPYDICTNILRSVSMDYGFELEKHESGAFVMDELYNSQTAGTVGSVTAGGGRNLALHSDTVNGGSSSGISSTMLGNGSPCTSATTTTNMMLSSSSFDEQTLLHGLGNSSSASDTIDIDSNNNSSSFCMDTSDHLAGAIVKGSIGSPMSAAMTYDTVSLPPIDSLMKTTSPKYSTSASQQHIFDMDLLETGMSAHVHDLVDDYFNPPTLMHSSHHHDQFLEFHNGHQHQHNTLHLQQQQQQHGEMISTLHTSAPHELRLPRHVYSTEQVLSPVQTQHQHLHHQQMGPTTIMTEFHCLPNDTLSPADLINISLGASDVNISFDTDFVETGAASHFSK